MCDTCLVLSPTLSKGEGAPTLWLIKFYFYITSSFKIRYPSSAPLSFGEGLGVRTTVKIL